VARAARWRGGLSRGGVEGDGREERAHCTLWRKRDASVSYSHRLSKGCGRAYQQLSFLSQLQLPLSGWMSKAMLISSGRRGLRNMGKEAGCIQFCQKKNMKESH